MNTQEFPKSHRGRKLIVGFALGVAGLSTAAACSSDQKPETRVIHVSRTMTPSQRLIAQFIQPYIARDDEFGAVTCLDGGRTYATLLKPHPADDNGVSVAFKMSDEGVLTITPTEHIPGGAFDPHTLKISGFNDYTSPLRAADGFTQQLLDGYNCKQLPLILDH